MDSPPGALQSDLLTIKHTSDPATLFPSHAYGRGGVGHFLCTGHSRAGLNRLPQATAQPASLSVTARRRLASSRSAGSGHGGDETSAGTGSAAGSISSFSGFSLISSDPVSIGATPAWESGTVAHTHNFVASSRTTRPFDVPRASKWAAISYFENDPREVARHMAIIDHVQARHDEGKAAERQAEQARHNMWAEQQRENFRRQRLEQAARYARSGIRPRSAYADLGALTAAEEAHAAAAAAAAGGQGSSEPGSYTEDSGMGRAASVGGTPRAARDPTQRFFQSEEVRTVLSTPGAAGPPYVPPQPPFGARLRPATAGMGAHGGGDSGRFYGMYGGGSAVLRSGGASPGNLVGGPPTGGLQHAGSFGGGAGGPLFGGGGRTMIPLPKKTYVNVHERMAAEAVDAPSARVAAMAVAKARAEEERAQAALADELEELDTFEARMRSLQRARSRAARSSHHRASGAGPHGDDDRQDG